MPQHVERIAVSGSINEVKSSALSILQTIGVEVLDEENLSDSVLSLDEKDTDSNASQSIIRAKLFGHVKIREFDHKNNNPDLRVELELNALDDSKTAIRVGVFLHTNHQIRLSQSCILVSNKILDGIISDHPKISLKAKSTDFSAVNDKVISKKQLGIRFILIAITIALTINLALLLEPPRRFLAGEYDRSNRIDNGFRKNIALDHSIDANPEKFLGTKSYDFIMISLMKSLSDSENCRMQIELRRPKKVNLVDIQFKIILTDKSNWIINSKNIKFLNMEKMYIRRHLKWINFSHDVCSLISEAKIINIKKCVAENMSDSECRSLVKSDPKSSIKLEIKSSVQ